MTQERDNKNYWQNELNSLGIESKRTNELNDRHELRALADNIKQVYYRKYKRAYENNDKSRDDLRFDYII